MRYARTMLRVTYRRTIRDDLSAKSERERKARKSASSACSARPFILEHTDVIMQWPQRKLFIYFHHFCRIANASQKKFFTRTAKRLCRLPHSLMVCMNSLLFKRCLKMYDDMENILGNVGLEALSTKMRQLCT